MCWDHMSGLLNNNDKLPFKGYYCLYGKVCRFKHCAQHPDVGWALKLTVPMLQQKLRPKKAPVAIYPPSGGGGGGDQRRLHPKQRRKQRLVPKAPHLEDKRKQERVTSVGELDTSPPIATPRRQQHPLPRRPTVTTVVKWGTTPSTADRQSSRRVEKAKMEKEPPVQKRERTERGKVRKAVRAQEEERTERRVCRAKAKRRKRAVPKAGAKER